MGNRLKDKKIIIYQRVKVGTNYGAPIFKYKPIHAGRLWAYMRDATSSEYITSHAISMREEARFVIRWRPEIKAQMCIEYKGGWYFVERVDGYEGYKQDLKLYVSNMNMPDAGEIIPYDGE